MSPSDFLRSCKHYGETRGAAVEFLCEIIQRLTRDNVNAGDGYVVDALLSAINAIAEQRDAGMTELVRVYVEYTMDLEDDPIDNP